MAPTDSSASPSGETVAERYRRRSAAFAATVQAVPEDRWSAPSPCDGWDARAVVEHVVGTPSMFESLVGRELVPGPSSEDDPLAAWTHVRDQVQAHLEDPATADVAFDGFFGATTFAAAVDRFHSLDLVVHRWDLARAAGLPDALEPGDVAAVHEAARAFGEAFRSPGVAGPELTPPPGADAQTQMLAFYGRRAW